jgi:hypothetical protein
VGVSPDFKLTGNLLRESNQELLATVNIRLKR